MDLEEGVEKNLQNPENRLVLSIDQNGKIVFFNKKCEKIAGYSKNEVLDKKILDLLVPDRDRVTWEKIFSTVINDKSIDNFNLPWLNKDGQEIMASWTIAPFEESNSKMGDIGIIGELITKQSSFEEQRNDINVLNDSKKIDSSEKLNKKENIVLFRFGDKKIVFKKKPLSKNEKIVDPGPDKGYPVMKVSSFRNDDYVICEGKRKGSEDKQADEQDNKSDVSEIPKDSRFVFNRYDHKNLVKNYEEYDKASQSISNLKQKNKQLEEENKVLKEDLKNVNLELFNARKKIESFEKDQDKPSKKNKDLFKSSVNYIFDVAGGKKKKEELDDILKDLEERRNILYDIESELNSEKSDINNRRNELVKWREKLESLEREIEKRNLDLTKKEERVNKNLSFFGNNDFEALKEETEVLADEVKESEYHEILDKIPQSAAIIQRGILKQVNESFTDMLGYELDKVIEKNLFDFVTSEGFSGIESYYLKRLKGETVNSYETMFHTKNDENVAVEVSTKPVIFNGEKAEILVFKILDENHKPNDELNKPEYSEIDNESKLDENLQSDSENSDKNVENSENNINTDDDSFDDNKKDYDIVKKLKNNEV